MIRGSRRSGRRTSWSKTGWVRIAIRLPISTTMLGHLGLLSRIRWSEGRRVRLVVWTLASSFGVLGLRTTLVHRLLLLVALRWWRILAGLLLLLLRILIAITVLGQWLAVGAVELRVWRRVLPAPDGVRGYKRLGLCAHWREDTFL